MNSPKKVNEIKWKEWVHQCMYSIFNVIALHQQWTDFSLSAHDVTLDSLALSIQDERMLTHSKRTWSEIEKERIVNNHRKPKCIHVPISTVNTRSTFSSSKNRLQKTEVKTFTYHYFQLNGTNDRQTIHVNNNNWVFLYREKKTANCTNYMDPNRLYF